MRRRSLLLPWWLLAAKAEEPALRQLAAAFEGLRNALQIPGLSAAVVDGDVVVWAQGFGYADLEGRVAATKETVYSVASVTKTLVSTLILRLVEQGKLSVDDPVSQYSPVVKDRAITIRHVLSHTSEGKPGEQFRYNSWRFEWLDSVVERAGGGKLRELLAREILQPAGMKRSAPGMEAGAARRVLAKPYVLYGDAEQLVSPYPPLGISSAAGLLSTAEDLALYSKALDDDRLLRRETREMAWTRGRNTAGQTLPYALGWFVQEVQGQRLVWHYGQWPQYSSLLLKAPERRQSLVVLANSNALSAPFALGGGDVLASPFAVEYVRRFVEDAPGALLRQKEQEGRQAIAGWRQSQRARVRGEVKVDGAWLERVAGQYDGKQGRVKLVHHSGRLHLEFGGARYPLYAASRTVFFAKVYVAEVGVKEDASEVVLKIDGQEIRAVRTPI